MDRHQVAARKEHLVCQQLTKTRLGMDKPVAALGNLSNMFKIGSQCFDARPAEGEGRSPPPASVWARLGARLLRPTHTKQSHPLGLPPSWVASCHVVRTLEQLVEEPAWGGAEASHSQLGHLVSRRSGPPWNWTPSPGPAFR